MERGLSALAIGYHRLLLILALVLVAAGSFAFGLVVGFICSWICLVLIALAWSPHRQ